MNSTYKVLELVRASLRRNLQDAQLIYGIDVELNVNSVLEKGVLIRDSFRSKTQPMKSTLGTLVLAFFGLLSRSLTRSRFNRKVFGAAIACRRKVIS